ncbi:MAG: FAD binding domain-containing protein [Janthinobacterium lividum]
MQRIVDRVEFRLNGTTIMLAPDVAPTMTMLHWLRGPAGLCGTKEGCAEGDCGACTVVIEERDGGRTPVNACLLAIGQLHGASVRTIEGIRGAPVQAAFAAGDATQCGFCTPGFVMAAWAHQVEGGDVHEALAGNLCRCTGYRPIVDVVAALAAGDEVAAPLVMPGPAMFEGGGCRFHRPTEMTALLALRAALPGAWLLAGGTDLGVGLAEGQRPETVICLSGVPALMRVEPEANGIWLGAAVPYARLLREVDGAGLGALRPLLGRLGSRQIRGLGTIGGNLGTASPIGDMLPPLLALGAVVRLRSFGGSRDLPVEEFLLGYRRTALRADEIIEGVFLPRPPSGATLVCEKLSKRYDQDISAVSATFLLDPAGTTRLAFGGMGPMAIRARHAEAALAGEWSPAALERAAAALADDVAPLSDGRGTASYRLAAAQGLLRRLWWRVARPELAADVQAL